MYNLFQQQKNLVIFEVIFINFIFKQIRYNDAFNRLLNI